MDEDYSNGSYSQHCSACGRGNFRSSGAFQNHSRACQPTKKRLRTVLTAAKGALARKRQRRIDSENQLEPSEAVSASTQNVVQVDVVRRIMPYGADTALTRHLLDPI